MKMAPLVFDPTHFEAVMFHAKKTRSRTAIDPAYLIRVCMLRESCAIGESIVCYDIRNLYKFMLKKNREPTSNTAFPPEEVAKITQLYRTMTNQPNAEALHPRRFSFLDVTSCYGLA